MKDIQFTGTAAKVTHAGGTMVIEWPRAITHHHTYGLLTPFFNGLKLGHLLATYCQNSDCPNCGDLWLPPRADCPDCHQRMEWKDLSADGQPPIVGEVFTFTKVEYPGAGIEISFPYYQIDIRIPRVCTTMKGYLVRGEAIIGMKVKPVFRTGDEATNTILDLAWEPA